MDKATKETKPEVKPETVLGDQQPVKCSKIQPNKMACSRKATYLKQGDPENKYAMCSVCFALDKSPEGYTVRLGE